MPSLKLHNQYYHNLDKVCKSLWKVELRRTEPFLDYLYDYSILSEMKPMPKSKKKPRPAWDTLFDALKENGNVRDMTNIYLEIQCQALYLHTFETRRVYCFEGTDHDNLPFINSAIFQESYIGEQLKANINFVILQNWWRRAVLKLEPYSSKSMKISQKFRMEKLENLIKELGKFQKPEEKV